MPSPNPDDISRRRTLHPQRYAMQEVFSRQVLASMRFDEDHDYLLDRMIRKLEVTVYQEKHVDDQEVGFTHYFEFPSNPWQYLKERFAPEWYVKRRPVQYDLEKSYGRATLKRTSWAKWPEMQYVPQDMGRPFVISEMHPDIDWYAQ